LVAIAIIAVVAAVVIPSVGSQLRSGDEGRVHQDLFNIRSAIEQFLADVRRYPQSLHQLTLRPAGVADSGLTDGLYTSSQANRWRGPYLTKDSAGARVTGFDSRFTNRFSNEAWNSQNFLTISLPLDSLAAYNVDLRVDDGVKTTGAIRWSSTGTPTLKFFAIPIQ
jgi:type II secretory pathway pseudopilin PulG